MVLVVQSFLVWLIAIPASSVFALREDSCKRYLDSIRPLVNDDHFLIAGELTRHFEQNEGKALHDRLVAKDNANKHTSYISDLWYDMYLSARTPLPLNYNPFMAIQMDPRPQFNDQTVRATNLIIAALQFKRALDEDVLFPEVFHLNPKKSNTNLFRNVCRMLPPSLSWYGAAVFKAFPLDMSQHPYLFGSTRIPQAGKDRIATERQPLHLVVFRNGHVFRINVMDDKGLILPAPRIMASLSHIASLPLKPTAHPIAVLTTLERDAWAATRDQLLSDPVNADSLQTVDSALFAVNLDDQHMSKEDPETAARSCLHGDGLDRWFDKSFQLSVSSNGLASINFEHAWGDGVAVLRLLEDIYKTSLNRHWVSPATIPEKDFIDLDVHEVHFNYSEAMKHQIKKALEGYRALTKSLNYGFCEYFDITRDYLKKKKLSPDSIMQLAIQMAYREESPNTVATYESCSTAAFKHGRTETMRPATMATKRFVEQLATEPGNKQKLAAMLRLCSDTHFKLVKDASMGKGFDRHLFALRKTAEEAGEPTPSFFDHETYDMANHYVLSTSTLTTDTVILGGFGPVVPEGYGIGYIVGTKRLGCSVTAYNNKRDAACFAERVGKSLKTIKNILET